MIAALTLLEPVLKWVTTGDHLLKTLGEGYWPVAGMGLLLLAGALIAAWAAARPSRHAAIQTSKSEQAVEASNG